jgi:glycosyltransferase involved in cell wall biosynthesis
MSDTDLTLVVTVHNETLVSGPTIESAQRAVAAARKAGYQVQTVIALDNATEATTEYFHQPEFDGWERWTMHEGDLGRVRNAIAPRTDGRYIAYLDADDLFSENWLAKGVADLEAARQRGERAIAHPEVIITFDGTVGLHQNVAQDSPLFTPYFLYVRNCYDSLCMTPREAHLDIPYIHRDIANGLSYQDWQFAIETMSRGWKHVLVQDTIIFKRRRDFSLMIESKGAQSLVRSLPEMTIDRVRELSATQAATPTTAQ